MVELKERGWWDPGEMVTHRMSFDDVNAAYDMYENIEDDVVKVVMSICSPMALSVSRGLSDWRADDGQSGRPRLLCRQSGS